MSVLSSLRQLRLELHRGLAKMTDFFSGLEIKFKLSINIALIVILVIALFSALILPIQHRELAEATSYTGRVLLKKLSQNVHGPMLLSVNHPEKLAEVKVQVAQTMQMGMSGLEYLVVFDRNGKMVATSDSSQLHGAIPAEKLAELSQAEEVTMREGSSHYEFCYPILARDPGPPGDRKILLGLACAGFSKKVLAEPIERTEKLILIMATLVIVVSVLGIYFFAGKMVDEIHALSSAAREVGSGNLDVYVQPRSKDELGRLASDFNQMVKQLREKLQMQKFLSKLTVQMIQQRGGTKGDPHEGGRHNVTILFSDIRNFSAIAEDCEPEQIVNLINIYFDLQTRIIESNGGVVDKFMGDQIMAVFQGRRMVENAVRAAIEIQRQVKKLNHRRRELGEITFELGIGLNNGLAVMGNMGSSHRMDYTVIGDVVNIANRLCSHARSGQIIAEYGFASLLNGNYHITRLESIQVKGRTKPVDISEILYENELEAAKPV